MKSKIITLKKILTVETVYFISLFFISFLAPFSGSQAVAGPLVNASLFLAVIFIGVRGALLIALFPSVIALFSGILPIALAPMIPLIILSNVILVLVFNLFSTNFWKGVFLASFTKFVFLFLGGLVVANFVLSGPVALRMVSLMSWTQLVTALGGGVIAYLFLIGKAKKA